MYARISMIRLGAVMILSMGILAAVTGAAVAHCDTMDGPVVKDAKLALEKGDVTPVLKWVKPDSEPEIRAAFSKTMTVRAKGPEARELADMYFFETLVRVHRAGEGAPYEGLKPAGHTEPAIALADKALDNASADELVKEVTNAVADGIRERFDRVLEAKKHASESVESGRKYVEAYVTYVHYVERLHLDASGTASHTEEAESGVAPEHH